MKDPSYFRDKKASASRKETNPEIGENLEVKNEFMKMDKLKSLRDSKDNEEVIDFRMIDDKDYY